MTKYRIRPGMFCKDENGRLYLFLDSAKAVDIMTGEYLFTSEYDVDMEPMVNWAPKIAKWAEKCGVKDTGDAMQINLRWVQPDERVVGW